MAEVQNYVDLKINGRLFPLWILNNFKKYKLQPIEKIEGEDPCKKTSTENPDSSVISLHKYQSFIGAILDYRSIYHDALVYHGLGAGKTIAAINVYNVLYNYNPAWNVFILIKASLRDDPWLSDLKKVLPKEEYDERMKNIRFIHYDAPNAEKSFLNTVKESDATKKNIYIFDEAHNFIKNVYNNMITKSGKRAITIYDYIIQEKKENNSTRVILLSGTPAVNTPYELALIFNLLRPGIFPNTETKFNELYITRTGSEHKLNPENKNMFQRRILGLVSYYIGSNPNLFASKNVLIKNIHMDPYQQQVYEHFEYIEEQLEIARSRNKSGTTVYRSYTRQSSNFVFPVMGGNFTGENRPRPSKFKLSNKEAEKIISGETEYLIKDNKNMDIDVIKKNISMYLQAVESYIKTFISYLDGIVLEDEKSGRTLKKDIEIFKTEYKYKFMEFMRKHKNKSKLFQTLYSCSAKMIAIIFYMMRSKGPVLVFSNFVKMEGLEIFKIYMSYFGFGNYAIGAGYDYHRYTEFHGEIEREQRKKNLTEFNSKENIDGKNIKVILISPAGSEGINLRNVRQVHILEPYWNEVRITQLIGRAIRMCSHEDLPVNERKVDIFRYHASRSNEKETTDQDIYKLASAKHNLIDTFLKSIREAAIDCELFKNHNMINEEYSCFKFNEKSYFDKYIGPAYKEDIYYDQKINNGLNSINSIISKVKVVKIKARLQLEDELSDVYEYWYNPETGIVYDYELDFPVGKVLKEFGIPKKVDSTTYIVDEVIDVPKLKRV